MQKNKKPAFPGGVHPTNGYDKALSMDAATRSYCPETVTILSEQSFGGKCDSSIYTDLIIAKNAKLDQYIY